MKKNYESKLDRTGFVSIKNLPTNEELLEIYSKLYYQDESTRSKNYQESYNEKEIQHIELLNQLYFYSINKFRPAFEKNPGILLEVGAGEGFTLNKAKSLGWEIQGIDFSDFAIKKFNPDIQKSIDFGDAYEVLAKYKKYGKKFDVCIVFNVLEHVTDPRELLNTLRSLLKENGIILITVPNDFSALQIKALELGHLKEEFWVVPPVHLHYFNTKNLPKLMNELKFKILDMYATFPIDFFLFHLGSNYINEPKNGKLAHKARVELDLLMANEGIEKFYKLCQAYASCGVGRDITVIIESTK